ncbi:MAG: LamG domain-containing protein [Bacteroidota bacterium]|nr:LamG domain-containing protein [Bacteroidota bacterium]
MKKLCFLSLVMLVLAITSCKKENAKDSNGTVEFSVSLGSSSLLKSTSADSTAVASAIVVTIEDLNGKVLYNSERVELYNMNGSYISKPLSLVPGNYKLTKFMVVDKNSNVLYLTPVSGSAKAYLVNKPLAISFAVAKDQTTKISPEVISAKGSQPQDFGYATFSFNVVKTFNFLMGVFVYNSTSQNFELTSATVTVSSDSSSTFTKTIKAVTDTFTVRDGLSRYILKVTKDGYQTWSDTLSASELKLYYSSLDKGPLKVILLKSSGNDGLVAYYKFNQDVRDYSGNNNNGTYYGRKYYSFGHNQDTLSSIDLNGSTDYVVVKNSNSLNSISRQITLCAWVCPSSFYGNGSNSFISKITPNNSAIFSLGLSSDLYNGGGHYENSRFIFYVGTSTGTYPVTTTGDASTTDCKYVYFQYQLNKWYFVVGTYDGSIAKLYVNGELKAWRSFTGNIVAFNDDVYIGKYPHMDRSYYDYTSAKIDEARIYSRSLSQDEILQLYKQR